MCETKEKLEQRIGSFVPVSKFVLLDDRFTANAKMVYISLLLHMDGSEENHCFPGIKTIAAITGLSPATIKRAIKSFEEKGLLTIERVRGNTSHYHVNDVLPIYRDGDSYCGKGIAARKVRRVLNKERPK